jgi:hypothetical protein
MNERCTINAWLRMKEKNEMQRMQVHVAETDRHSKGSMEAVWPSQKVYMSIILIPCMNDRQPDISGAEKMLPFDLLGISV